MNKQLKETADVIAKRYYDHIYGKSDEEIHELYRSNINFRHDHYFLKSYKELEKLEAWLVKQLEPLIRYVENMVVPAYKAWIIEASRVNPAILNTAMKSNLLRETFRSAAY